MKLEAMRHQGKRFDLTSTQVGQKLKEPYSVEKLASELGESRNQIQRYIRLTYLIIPLQNMVDGIDENSYVIALNPAYELSFLHSNQLQVHQKKMSMAVIKCTAFQSEIHQVEKFMCLNQQLVFCPI